MQKRKVKKQTKSTYVYNKTKNKNKKFGLVTRLNVFTAGMHKDSKSSQDMASEKASTGSEEVFTSVRFAKKVLIENSSTVGQSTKVRTS